MHLFEAELVQSIYDLGKDGVDVVGVVFARDGRVAMASSISSYYAVLFGEDGDPFIPEGGVSCKAMLD